MTSLTRTVLVTVAVASALSLAACSASTASTGPGGTVSGSATGSAASVEPVEAYLAAAENDWHVAMRAHFASNQEKLARCMGE